MEQLKLRKAQQKAGFIFFLIFFYGNESKKPGSPFVLVHNCSLFVWEDSVFR